MTTVDAIKSETVSFVDVRETYELEDDGKLEQATHIPMGDIPMNVEKIKEMQKPIVVFCKSGGRAGKAIEYLQENGVENIYNGGGYSDVINILNGVF